LSLLLEVCHSPVSDCLLLDIRDITFFILLAAFFLSPPGRIWKLKFRVTKNDLTHQPGRIVARYQWLGMNRASAQLDAKRGGATGWASHHDLRCYTLCTQDRGDPPPRAHLRSLQCRCPLYHRGQLSFIMGHYKGCELFARAAHRC